MLEVVFNDSAAGSLTLAVGLKDHTGDCAHDILSFPLSLSVGNISENGIGAEREKALSLLWGMYRLTPRDVKDILNKPKKHYSLLLERARDGEPIRVWSGRDPDELCGLYWLMEQLRPVGLEKLNVTLVEPPAWRKRSDNSIVRYTGWGEVAAYRFGRSRGKRLPAEYLRFLADHWKRLQQENAPLRAVLNGDLVSVPETLYDAFIFRELETQADEFEETRLIGQVMENQLGIGYMWIALRIERFIKDGLLTPVTAPGPDEPVSRRILKKRTTLSVPK